MSSVAAPTVAPATPAPWGAPSAVPSVATGQVGPGQVGPLLNLQALIDAPASLDPYQHLLIENFLTPGAAQRLTDDYPDLSVPGYIAMEREALTPTFRQLEDELKGEALTQALSEKFGRDFHPYPRMITLHRWSHLKEGHIHTDSKRKIMTMLLYLNPSWVEDAGGKLRVLYDGKNFDPYAREVSPTIGTSFAFTRSENSWHGHLPFEGERRVIQVTWLLDDKAVSRKTSNSRFHRWLKALFAGKTSDQM
ncbi:hypothetical protein BH10PSE2_BH10PSE2_18260 [soil metagenome]